MAGFLKRIPRLATSSQRWISSSFKSKDLQVTLADPKQLKAKPDIKDLVFGKYFTDHMLRIKWSQSEGWSPPAITPLQDLTLHPAAKVLHYAQELFEGMKAYRGVDDAIRLFRPMHNMARMAVTAKRSCLPEFNEIELAECIRQLVLIDQEWVPHSTASSLYIRPTMIGTCPTLGVTPSNQAELFVILSPTGPYWATGVKPVSLMADPDYVRAWPGGSGFAKMGSNYAPTMWISKMAERFNCQQALWLFGPDAEITEVGAMNIFAFFDHGNGKKELVTPPLSNGVILPGVTRRSVLQLTKSWNEFQVSERKLTMKELLASASKGRLVEVFGTGTAAIVSPVGSIYYNDKMFDLPLPETALSNRIMEALTDIYYGRVSHPWGVNVERWDIDAEEQKQTKEYRLSLERNFKQRN